MISDLRFTLRTLAQRPGFAAVAILTLTLGIGVNTAVFSIVNAALLRGLPFPAAERLWIIETGRPAAQDRESPLSPGEFTALRRRQQSFEELSAFSADAVLVASPGANPERVLSCTLAGPGLALLRVPAALGRWFGPAEDQPGAAPTVVIGHALWRSRFAGDPAVIGQPLKVNGEWCTILGVAPEGFRFPERAELWRPWRMAPVEEMASERHLAVFGRLRETSRPEAARAELAAIGRRWEAEHPRSNAGVVLTARPLHEWFLDDTTRQLLGLMFGAVALVLLIACANVANLLLARAAARRREMHVRAALGASRGRLMRLLLTESLVLAGAGALGGLLLAEGLMAIFRRHLAQMQPPYWMVFDVDARGLAYVGLLAVISCLLAGLLPAWRISRPDPGAALKDGGHGSTGRAVGRLTRVMVIGEIALSCVLLVVALLTVRRVTKIESKPLGFEPAGVFTCRIDLPYWTYGDTGKQRRFYADLLERLAERVEVAEVALSSVEPIYARRQQVEFEGRPRGGASGSGLPPRYASRAEVSEQYFATLRLRLMRGRVFTVHDHATAPRVAIVSTRFAEIAWPGEDPIGRRFGFGLGPDGRPEQWLTVVGVVAQTHQEGAGDVEAGALQAYVPYTQQPEERNMTLFARARGMDPAALAPLVRSTVRSLDDELPIFWVQTLQQMIDRHRFFQLLFARIFGLFGLVALAIAAVGLYGVMSYAVSRRTQEFGVRLAIGAQPHHVFALVLRDGAWQVGAGLLLGLPAAYGGGRLLAAVLTDVVAGELAVYVTVVAVLVGIGVVACAVPARRALRVNPVEALRCE
jgi:predicted permease